MMTYRKLGENFAAEPFRPFPHPDGERASVRHPAPGNDLSRADIGEDLHRRRAEPMERWHDASMLLMETVEPLDAPVPQANG